METFKHTEEIPLVDPELKIETKEHHLEYPHKEFMFNTGDAIFSVLFKPQEEMVPLELVDKKSVVFVGDTPYARDQTKVREYYESIKNHVEFHTLQHAKASFGSKYHFSVNKRMGDGDWREYKTDTLITQTPLRSQTDLLPRDTERLRESGKDARAEFIVNSDAESVVHAAKLIAKLYPKAVKGAPMIKENIFDIEDYIIAASFNEKGECVDAMDETRDKVIRALLGYEEDAKYLEQKLRENAERFPSLKVCDLMDTRYARMRKLDRCRESIEFRQNQAGTEGRPLSDFENDVISASRSEIQRTESDIVLIGDLIKQYQEGGVKIPEEIIKELDKYVVIHMTDFYPVFDENEKRWVIPTHSKATGDRVGRLSVHFSVDGIATATGLPTAEGGTWTQKPYAVVAPLGQMVKLNGLMDNLMPADAWWVMDPNDAGVKLPESATIVARTTHGDGDIQRSLVHRPGKGIDKVTLDIQDETFIGFVKDKYGASLAGLGNDSWQDDSKMFHSASLFESINRVNPFMHQGRHSSMSEERFERGMIGFLNAGLLADNTGELAEASLEKERVVEIQYFNHENKLNGNNIRVPREFARQMVKTGIL